MIVVVIVLVLVIAVLAIYNFTMNKRIQNFKNIEHKITNLSVIQDFINVVGTDMSVDDKIKEIKNIIIEKYEVKYSTIVIFDGTDYIIKATNVDPKHWQTLSTLYEVDIFKDSITTTSPKYITVNNEKEMLPYQKQEFGRAKSAIFFPLYIDNVFIGYWLIESSVAHDFDNIDISIYDTDKENIVTIYKAINYQKTLESIVRKDLFSGLNSAEYLYGEGKKIIDKFDNSAICMFRIQNIEEINKISRELGNKVITKVSEFIKDNIIDSYIFVRYMGPKFVIAFCGVDKESASDFVGELKENAEKLTIKLDEDNFTVEEIGKNKKRKEKEKRC